MSAAKNQPEIYNIPSGIAFAQAIAAQLILETKAAPEALATYQIILPNRRACRVLREAFLQQTDGKPLLLPRLYALGDIDEEELSLTMAGREGTDLLLQLPPAIAPLRRQIMLARTVWKIPGRARSFDQALLLAAALGRLMDQVYTEGLDLKNLARLVPESFADHWQITLKFMEILSEAWPKVLAEMGVIDGADRRNRLLRSLAKHWESMPPQSPVIAAGTTGSIPATAKLLQVISQLPQGRVILPGLDADMDEESWDNLEETHPQYGLKHLLQQIGLPRENVRPWPGMDTDTAANRRFLAREVMRPAATTGSWNDLATSASAQQKINSALSGMALLECANEREEAGAIAVLLRGALEIPGRTATLITPRRSLARHVSAQCRRWGIAVDDSAGETLDKGQTATFLRLCLEACHLSPVAFLSLLKHPLCRFRNKDGLFELDISLRGLPPARGFTGLTERLEAKKAVKAPCLIRAIEPQMTRFMNGSDDKKSFKFNELIKAHLQLAETLSHPETLWAGENGEKAAEFFASLLEQAGAMPDITLHGYSTILLELMKTVTVRPVHTAHPRLHILGQLEARLVDSDLIIMAGLNEKSWPPDARFDPWMSRPMRKEFGLPAPERGIGLAAHDFVQGFCAPEIALTRSLRQDGAPAVPARWLQRLSAVLEAAHTPENLLTQSPAIGWARGLDRAENVTPARRPAPKPPLKARPRKIPVTQVEKWQQDPYSVYARYVLDLKLLKPLEQDIDAAEKGTMLHAVLKQLADAHPQQLPPNANLILTGLADSELAKRPDNPAAWSFWRRRFERLAEWLVIHETEWRDMARIAGSEVEGSIVLKAPGGDFTLEARADRIDILPGGGAVIDYKSGGTYTQAAIKTGKLPQLALEGLILAQGGFDKIAATIPVALQCWKLTGGAPEGQIIGVNQDINGIIAKAETGLMDFINAFDNETTPYYSLPRPANAPRFNDYEHLARVREWAALGETDDGEAAA